MKKVVSIVLAIALMMTLGIAVYAARGIVRLESPVGEDGLSLLISTTATKGELVRVQDANKLPEESQKVFDDAYNTLEEAVTDEYVARFFFYLSVSEPCDAVFNIDYALSPMFMQYVEGAWTKLECVDNGDHTVTVKNVTDAPMAVLFPVQ